jgi:hypothetical protein
VPVRPRWVEGDPLVPLAATVWEPPGQEGGQVDQGRMIDGVEVDFHAAPHLAKFHLIIFRLPGLAP